MRQWVVGKGSTSFAGLRLVNAPEPAPGPGEVKIRVHACSLNYRDQMIPLGKYMGGPVTQDTVPLSDGVGEVVALGEEVSGFAVGDRVAGCFFQNWIDGPPNPGAGPALGAPPATGMLQDFVCLPAQGVVPIAQSLFE